MHVRENAPFEKIFVHEELLDKLRTVLPEGTDFELITMGESADDPPDSSTVSYQLNGLMASAGSEFDWPQIDEFSTAHLMFTSGTTGKPKAVAHSHKMVWHNSLGIAAAKNLGPQDSILMVPPLFHLGWMLWGVAPVTGADLILPGKGYPDNLLDLIIERDVTFSTGVPTLFKRVVDTVKKRRINGEDVSLEGLEVVFGGQAPPTELMRNLEGLGGTASQLYGYTEGGTNYSFSIQNDLRPRERALDDEELLEYKSEVSGYFVPGIEARLVDPETGDELEWDSDAQGEL
jgi:fatty-acyl-CoA synthase